MRQQVECVRPPSALVHLPRRQAAVVIDPIEMVAEVPVGVVLKLMLQLAHRAVGDDRLMNVLSLPARRAPVVQPRLMIRIEISGSDPSAEVKGDAGNAKGAFRRLTRHDLAYFSGERWRDPFVGVERKDPVV